MITLRPITPETRAACEALSVHESQSALVHGNAHYLKQAESYPEFARPLGVFNSDGVMVGFILFSQHVVLDEWFVFCLMIDRQHQGKGYGGAALDALLAMLRAEGHVRSFVLDYHRSNAAARKLYLSRGFVEEHNQKETHFRARYTFKHR